MNDDNLKQLLIDAACSKGICVPGQEKMMESDIDSLIDYYLANPDWCMERDYPSVGFLKERFNNIEDKGVYVGKTFHGEMLNERQVYVFHECRGTIRVGLNVDKGMIPMLYLANRCRLRIVGVGDFKPLTANGRSIVPVYIFGENDISARDNKYVRFNVYKHPLL